MGGSIDGDCGAAAKSQQADAALVCLLQTTEEIKSRL
jgi:hypothetical protein